MPAVGQGVNRSTARAAGMVRLRRGCTIDAMAHRTSIMVAAAMLGWPPGVARASDALADLTAQVETLRIAKHYAEAAKLAAESAAREDLADDARVLLGGLARQNFELSYENKGPITDLCSIVTVMRLVAPLDTPAGSKAKLKVAEDAKTRLEAATGQTWSAVCPASPDAETDVSKAKLPGPDASDPAAGETTAPEMSREVVVRPTASPSPARPARRRVGMGTLIPGVMLVAPVAAVLAYRADINGDLAALRATTSGRPNTPDEETTGLALNRRYQNTTIASAVLGTVGAALVVTGVILLVTGGKPRRVAVAPWGTRGLGGLVLQGRF